MLRIDTNQKEKLANFCRTGLAIMAFWLIVGSGWLSLAQSGHKKKQSQADPASSNNSDTAKDNKKVKELPTEFILATAPPDYGQSIYASYHQPPNFEYQACGGCLAELKGIRGVKVIEDEDLDRWEARQTALSEDKAWVIWMELRWDKTTSFNSSINLPTNLSPFRLRYLLFEPGTGKMRRAVTAMASGRRGAPTQKALLWKSNCEKLAAILPIT